ncbi:MAG: hypothetical protein HXN48_01240 [Prevotella nanceiensis]|nr:hypothetical protein [Hoylesella nanceiensis]
MSVFTIQKQCYYNLKALLLAGNKRTSVKILKREKGKGTLRIDNKKTFVTLFQHHKDNRIIT